MGQKRIKLVDLGAQEEQKKAARGKGKKKLTKEKKAVKAGKGKHGRLADMGASPEEAEKTLKEEKITEAPEEESKKTKKAKKPKKVRSKRYQALREKIDKTKAYTLEEALPLIIEMANSHFDETLELHLVMKKTNAQTEKKFPLVHKKIGKVSEGEKKLLKTIQKNLASVRANEIRKAVLTSTMSPSIRLNLEEL